ncbi:hypothetical protein QEM02_003738 [Pseudomonas putida]|nr:hypothetical protein [Pseudomonas putida]
MNNTFNRIAGLACTALVTAGCAATPPNPSSQSGVVEFSSQRGVALLGEKEDGVKTENGSYFIVTPGAHTLSIRVKQNINPNFARSCYGDISYDAFKANTHYVVRYENIGGFKTLSLYENQKVVATQTEFSAAL